MKICFVSDAGSYHTKKWAKWFSERGHEISVISFTPGEIENVDVKVIDTGVAVHGSELKKLKYFLYIKKVRNIIDEIKPDIVNVHYATSYGTVVALSGVKDYILSMWGSDIYDFPQKSIFHKWMLKFSLSRARYLFSTSKAMAIEARKYTQKKIEITPFGVDMELFNTNKRTRRSDDCEFVVGTIKSLADKYGIDYLIRAIKIIKSEYPEIPIKLRIAGRGPKELEYKKLAEELNVNDIITWLGFISQERAAEEWANMDVAIVYSTLESESFGVSAVEAEACGVPVIISNIPGLMEATKPNETSVVINRCDEMLLANAILSLYRNKEQRLRMGMKGRKYVSDMYELQNCFLDIEKKFVTYNEIN